MTGHSLSRGSGGARHGTKLGSREPWRDPVSSAEHFLPHASPARHLSPYVFTFRFILRVRTESGCGYLRHHLCTVFRRHSLGPQAAHRASHGPHSDCSALPPTPLLRDTQQARLHERPDALLDGSYSEPRQVAQSAHSWPAFAGVANHCEHCDALQGDFETIEESDSPLNPLPLKARQKSCLGSTTGRLKRVVAAISRRDLILWTCLSVNSGNPYILCYGLVAVRPQAWVCVLVRVDPMRLCLPWPCCRAHRTRVAISRRRDKRGSPSDTTHGVFLSQPDRHIYGLYAKGLTEPTRC